MTARPEAMKKNTFHYMKFFFSSLRKRLKTVHSKLKEKLQMDKKYMQNTGKG